MFDAIRKYQRLGLGFILLLILPAFVFFGVSGYEKMLSGSDDVAVVAGQPISRQAFEQAHRNQIDQMQKMFGDQVDVRLFDTPEARQQTLESLVTQQALLAEARERRIAVPPAEVQKMILAIDGLKDADGKFDFERYKTALAQQNLSPAMFEAQVAQDLTVRALGNAVQDSAIVPKAVVERLFALQEAQRTIRVRVFDPKEREAGLKPSEEQLRKYYDEQTEAFRQPESVDVEYVVLDRSKLAGDLKVSDSELQAYYEQNKGQFNEPEQRRASHILIPVTAGADAKTREAAKAKATALLADVRAQPSRFAELAKTESGDPGSAEQGGDLGFFDRDMMVKPFADAAFALQQGQLADLVESEYGYHVVMVTGVKGAGTKPFAEVRDQIESLWRQQQSAKRYSELAEQFNNTVYEQSDSLQPAVTKFAIPLQQAERVERTPKRAAGPDAPLANPRLLGQLFGDDALKNKRNTEATEVAPGVLVSARVTAHHPARRQPFEEVRDEVAARWVAAEAARLAREQGEQALAALKGGPADADALAGFAPAKSISRAQPGDTPPQVLLEAFRLPAEPLPAYAGVDLGARGYQLVRLEKVDGPDASAESRRARYQQQAEQVAAAAASGAWVESVTRRTPIERRSLN
ncbi:MAG: SurA N-terminal domain-containing protein [Lautropia sp.]